MKKYSEVTHISMAGNRKRTHTHTEAKQVNRSSQKEQERRGERETTHQLLVISQKFVQSKTNNGNGNENV